MTLQKRGLCVSESVTQSCFHLSLLYKVANPVLNSVTEHLDLENEIDVYKTCRVFDS